MQSTPIADRLAKLPELTLHHGSHSSFATGHCALEIVAWLAGEEHTDEPACACPAISAFVRQWNDGMPDDATRTRVLGPLLPLMLNTRPSATPAGDKLLVRRAYLAIDWHVRVRAPAFLRAAGLDTEAAAIEALPEIDTARKLAEASQVVEAARKKANAARNAAESAARSAAWNAARNAAWNAAENAARSAAWNAAESAARSAAWNAAESAAESAAWNAARNAAENAVRSAAESAAESAAWNAARNAAWNAAENAAENAVRSAAESAAVEKLRPTVDALHVSGAYLVRHMCALTEADVAEWSWADASA